MQDENQKGPEDDAPQPQYLNVNQQRNNSRGRAMGANSRSNSRSKSQKNRQGQEQFTSLRNTSQQKKAIKKNPIYDHVQAKLYNPTVTHDIKQTIAQGKPPMTQKAMEIQMQAQQNFARDHSFKPQINNDYKGAPQREISKEERWQNLYQPRTEKILQRDMMRAQREIEDIKKHCTFKPQLGSVNDLTTEGGSILGSARKHYPPMPQSARSQSFQKRIPI